MASYLLAIKLAIIDNTFAANAEWISKAKWLAKTNVTLGITALINRIDNYGIHLAVKVPKALDKLYIIPYTWRQKIMKC